MEKIKLEDVNILIDEYDEMLVELQRDDYNLYKNSIIPFGLSILLSPLIVYVLNIFLKYNENIYTIIFFTIFILIFVLIFLAVYNLLSIIGLNKVLDQIKSENKVNYDTSVIKGILKNIGFNFEKNKISWLYFIKPRYSIDYNQVSSIFKYRMYLKYEIVSKKKLLEELAKIRELKRNNKNAVIQFLKEKGIVLFIFTIITALINNYYPAIFEKLKNDGNIDSMNNIFLIHLSIFVFILVFPYIISICVKSGKNFQMQKLKVIENCVYYLNNFEKIEITETINKLEKQEKIVFEIKKLQVESDNNKTLKKLEELQVEIEENFGEISRKYLKEYRDIYNNQETSDEEKQEKLSNKLSELLVSMEIEKNLYKKSKILENQDLIKSKIINKKLWIILFILFILFLVVSVVLYNNSRKKEYILNNPTNEDIVIITDSEKIKIPKNSNVKKILEKFDIKFESGKKCELSFDSNKNERIINFNKNECFFQDELEIFEKKRNYILVNSTNNDIEITSDKIHYKLKSKYSIVLHLENGNYKLAEGCDLEVKDDSSGQLIKIKKENNKQKCDPINY